MGVRKMEDDCKVWVGGLADRTTWKELEAHMEANGGKPSLTEIMSKGTGVCAFKTAAEAAACIAAAKAQSSKEAHLKSMCGSRRKRQRRRERACRAGCRHSLDCNEYQTHS